MPASLANNSVSQSGDGKDITFMIDPYVKSIQIFKCPSDNSTNPLSYGYNYYYLARNGRFNATALASIQSPAQMVMMTDGNQGDVIYPPQFWGTEGTNAYGSVVDRHLETTNVLWADGHVKSQKISALKAPAGCSGAACDELWDLE